MPTYEVNGQEICTLEEGRPHRQKAILIHGWSSSSYAMTPLSGLLSQRFSCVSVDLPGYGQSPPLSEPATIPAYADLLVSLVEKISDGPVVLVGHSMGGMIGLTMALRHTALVERMVLICPTITGRLSRTINTLISPINVVERFAIGQLLVSGVERAYVGITDRLMRPVSFAERTGITEEEYFHLRKDARRPGQGRVRAQCFFAMRHNDLTARLQEIQTPALTIWGAEDNTVPLRDAGVLVDEWPQANLRIIPKAGHWPHFERPKVTRRLVAAYLGLPLLSDKLHAPVGDEELEQIQETARFLAHSGLGNNLNMAQRLRLAAQLQQHTYAAYHSIIAESGGAQELYLVRDGAVEVWSELDRNENQGDPGMTAAMRQVSMLKPGEVAGELSMLDEGARTADLIAGPEGATVLSLSRERMLAIMEDDPELSSQLLWNLANIMSQRVRFVLWQLKRAQQKAEAERASTSSLS